MNPSDGCGCNLRGPTALYAGKGVTLRARLQTHAYSWNRFKASSWLWDYTEDPHCHMVYAAVWYVPKWQMATAEATLISALKPLKNTREKEGFAPPSGWQLRPPDQTAKIESLEPHNPDPEDQYIRNEPGVYVWFYDYLNEMVAATRAVSEFLQPMVANGEVPHGALCRGLYFLPREAQLRLGGQARFASP